MDLNGERIKHDIIIRLNGEVIKRKKKLSKEIYGTSHKVSLAEAEYIYQEGAEMLVIGAGHFSRVRLSPEAEKYFQEQGCQVEILSTPNAVKAWNESPGNIIGLFHLTC